MAAISLSTNNKNLSARMGRGEGLFTRYTRHFRASPLGIRTGLAIAFAQSFLTLTSPGWYSPLVLFAERPTKGQAQGNTISSARRDTD